MHMLRKFTELRDFTLAAQGVVIGKPGDLYFDDDTWTVRYIVLRESAWFSRRQVLISPIALGKIDDNKRVIDVNLTAEQIKNSPPADSDTLVSRQFEKEYYRYYGWPTYWMGEGRWGASAYPTGMAIPDVSGILKGADGVSCLRSLCGLIGYAIEARDGAIGEVVDANVNDETWALRYLVVNTRMVLPGKEILISPHWLEHIAWDNSIISADLSLDQIRNAPGYDPGSVLTRHDEAQLFRYFGREDDREAVRVRHRAASGASSRLLQNQG
jgi:hypothetical protein